LAINEYLRRWRSRSPHPLDLASLVHSRLHDALSAKLS
jgi:hypothetical protein